MSAGAGVCVLARVYGSLVASISFCSGETFRNGDGGGPDTENNCLNIVCMRKSVCGGICSVANCY